MSAEITWRSGLSVLIGGYTYQHPVIQGTIDRETTLSGNWQCIVQDIPATTETDVDLGSIVSTDADVILAMQNLTSSGYVTARVYEDTPGGYRSTKMYAGEPWGPVRFDKSSALVVKLYAAAAARVLVVALDAGDPTA